MTEKPRTVLTSMSMRTTESTVCFDWPFQLSELDHVQPAGSYLVVTEEERIEGLSFAAFRRVRTMLHLPGNALPGRIRQVIDIDPVGLASAVVADALRSLGMRSSDSF